MLRPVRLRRWAGRTRAGRARVASTCKLSDSDGDARDSLIEPSRPVEPFWDICCLSGGGKVAVECEPKEKVTPEERDWETWEKGSRWRRRATLRPIFGTFAPRVQRENGPLELGPLFVVVGLSQGLLCARGTAQSIVF